MDCRQLVELVNDYLEGALGEAGQRRFEAHISACANCRKYLDQVRKTVALTGRLSEESLPPAMRDRLLSAFHDWKQAK
jgi:predicted anti-sigma-YlaC factor YlaD